MAARTLAFDLWGQGGDRRVCALLLAVFQTAQPVINQGIFKIPTLRALFLPRLARIFDPEAKAVATKKTKGGKEYEAIAVRDPAGRPDVCAICCASSCAAMPLVSGGHAPVPAP
jgi:hypothetical protein